MPSEHKPVGIALLGESVTRLRLQELPPEVVHRAKQRLLDTLGCLVAGYDAGPAQVIREYVLTQGGSPEATLLPGGQKTTVALACMAHATYIHGLELSDAAPRGTAHPGNEIIPAVIAMAERLSLGGAAILPAIVAGYEVEVRFGRTVFPGAFYRGWWTPGMLGATGSAAAVANMLGLNGAGVANALGIVLNLSPSAMAAANAEGAEVKWIIGGQACAAGTFAAELAARGLSGMQDIESGWMRVICDETHPERLTDGIATDGTINQWELLSGIVTKFYATVGPLTSSLDATFDLIKRHDIQASQVAEIHVDCMRRTAVFNNPHPTNDVAAKASLPYCLAVAVCTHDPVQLLGAAFRPERFSDREVAAIAAKVRITENESYEAQYPAHSKAKVTIRLKDGAEFSQEVDRSTRGRYLTPTDNDIEWKFRQVAGPVLGGTRSDRIIDLVSHIEQVADVRELTSLLCDAHDR